MPKNAVRVVGQYNSAGIVGTGFVAADLPYDHPCISTTKYPGHIVFDVQHYQGDGVKLFRMQVDAVEKQTLQNERTEMERACAALRKNTSTLDKMSDLKTETVPGGTLLYYDYYSDCSEGVKRSMPAAKLLGIAHTDTTRINIKIDGFINAETAKAAALEVLANFLKADFGQLSKGK